VAQPHQYLRYFFRSGKGHMRPFLQDPKEEGTLKPREVYVVRAIVGD
jgi:hypothetical protein